MILQLALILVYLLIFAVTVPAFWRLIRNQAHCLDAVKACCALLAASIINSFFMYSELGLVLYDFDEDRWRTVSAVITSVIFFTLCVVVLRTERAMSSGKS